MEARHVARRLIPMACLLGLLAFAFIVPVSAQATQVFINEIHYDNTGTDAGEAIEVAGPAGTDLTGWSLVLYNGTNGTVYNTTLLSGTIPNQMDGFGTVFVDYPSNGIQNGAPDGLALVDASSTVIQFLSYEGAFAAVGGPADGLTSTDIGVLENGSGALGNSMQLAGTGSLFEDFTWQVEVPNTFGTVNTSQIFGSGGPVAAFNVVINEVDSDTPGTDTLEFVELHSDNGNGDLSGLAVVFYNGSNDLSYASYDLDGFTTDANGFFVLGNSAVFPAPSLLFPGNTLQNGADAVAVYAANAADFPTGTAVTTVNLVDAVVYDTADADDTELLALTPGQPQVDENGGGDGANQSSQRCPDGGTQLVTTSYLQAAPMAGGFNNCAPPPAEMRLVHDIQGSGDTSPLLTPGGGTVTVAVEALVVANYPEMSGYFLQEEDSDADADPATSEGIFVFDFTGTGMFAVGDLVQVTGNVSEFNSSGITLTELSGVSDRNIVSSGNPLPAPVTVTLPVSEVSYWERYEGMLVTIPQELTATETYTLGRYGEILLAEGGRLRIPTHVAAPGAAANAVSAENARRQILLDDGSNVQNPPVVIFPAPQLAINHTVRGGDTASGVTGVLDQRFGTYRIQPVQSQYFNSNNPRPATPTAVGGSLKVASANVLNYFTTLTSQDSNARGADTAEEFERQKAKIINELSAMNADVVGLMEIENRPGDAVPDLVDGLNQQLGAGTYAYIDTGVIGTDAIKVALIYKPASVTPVGNFAILDSSVDPNFIDTRNRPALAQTFSENATNGIFTVAVNHLKSKGSACDDIGDPDTGDGQGNCNVTRTTAAEALVNWLATDPTSSGDPDFLIIGDLNSYAMEDPIQAILSGGYVNLVAQFLGAEAYSYVFDGEWGYLDHALANTSLAGQVAGVTEWHNNADEPVAFDYNDYNQVDLYSPEPFRASDHDPVIIGLNLTPATLEVAIDIRPLIPFNLINLNSLAQVPVAVLSSPAFDATFIDADTVTLAGAPAVPERPRWPKFQHLDVNGDGLKDMLLLFNIQDLQLEGGATEATLQGQTLTGQPFTGTDSVIIIPRFQAWLLAPDNGDTVRTSRPLFRWVPQALNTCYLIQINDAPFTLDEQSSMQEATVVSVPLYLSSRLADGTYYWRVRVGGSCNIETGLWSDVWSFTVNTRR